MAHNHEVDGSSPSPATTSDEFDIVLIEHDDTVGPPDRRVVTEWPEEWRRRSRIDWHAIVPEYVAEQQIAWEKARTIAALIDDGFNMMGLTIAFAMPAYQLTAWASLARYGHSPAVEYLSSSSEIALSYVHRARRQVQSQRMHVKSLERAILNADSDLADAKRKLVLAIRRERRMSEAYKA